MPRFVRSLASGIVAVSYLLSGCAGLPSPLDPQGPAAARIAGLSWLLFGLGAVIYVAVVGFLLVALFRRRRNPPGDTPNLSDGRDGTHVVVLGGLVFPAVILVVVFGFTLSTLAALSAPNIPDDLTIEVIGHQWWWEVKYPNQQVTAANEIHIPVGQPVEVKLTSIDVIHSFWIPQLNGKLDLIPGRTNTTWLQADQPGEYRGLCAEFCGIQHANMQFIVAAESLEQFSAWLDLQRQPAAEPAEPTLQQGQQVFLGSTCADCHTVKGTNTLSDLGPDLTHLASRRTLAAGTLENKRGNLAGWIVDPQHIKPGNLMPLVVVENGRPLKDRLNKSRIDEANIMAAARHLQGLERMDEIKYAVLERSGGITIIPYSKS